MVIGSRSEVCAPGGDDGAGGRVGLALPAGRAIDPVTSPFDSGSGGFNSDGKPCGAGFKSSGGVMAKTLLPDGGANGAIPGSFGSSSGLAAGVAGASGLSLGAAVSFGPVPASGPFAVLTLRASELPKSRKLPAIWIDPTTTATMLAAMNSDLTRFISWPRRDDASPSSVSTGSGRGARSRGDCAAACAARRAAAMKPDLPPGVAAVAGPAPTSAASEAAIRVAGLARNGGGPDPG